MNYTSLRRMLTDDPTLYVLSLGLTQRDKSLRLQFFTRRQDGTGYVDYTSHACDVAGGRYQTDSGTGLWNADSKATVCDQIVAAFKADVGVPTLSWRPLT